MANPKTQQPLKITWAHMIRDVLVASINKGQFLIALTGLIILVFIVRLPPAALQALAQSVVEKLDQGDLVGWLLFVFVSIAWAIISRRSRATSRNEISRIGKEKSILQQKLLGTDATSSET